MIRQAVEYELTSIMKEQGSTNEPEYLKRLSGAAGPGAGKRDLTLSIIIVSIAIPVAVAVIILVPGVKIDLGFNTHALPVFHAILNSSTAILLLASLYFIRKGQIRAHRAANLVAVVLSTLFLVSYVIYHASNPSVKYGDLDHNGVLSEAEKLQAGTLRYVYYFILSSHIILSGVIIPMVLFTLQRAFQEKFDKHRRLARITWPVWLYVAVTGVVVYFMISPYY
jgi:putative membrane protein